MVPFAMWTPGIWELLVILLIVFVLFGAGKLPQVFKTLGEGLKSFRDAQKEDPVDVGSDRKQIDRDHVHEAEEIREKV